MLSISSPTFNPTRWNIPAAQNRSGKAKREVLDMPAPAISRPKDVAGSLQFAGGMKFSRYAWNGTQTAGEAASGFRQYTEPGRITRETRQALEAETKSLGNKVAKALKSAGIELSKDDKLSFTVGSDGKISVNSKGLSKENRGKIEEIEEALNSVPSLAKQLKLNSAGKKVNDRQYAEENAPAGTAAVTPARYGDNDPAMAAAQAELMDDYLQSNFGFGVADFAGQEWGEGEAYQKLYEHVESGAMNWDEGMELMNQVKSVAGNSSKESAASYTAAFTFQSGELTEGFGASTAPEPEQSEAASGASAIESIVARLNSAKGNIALNRFAALKAYGSV